MTEGSKNQENVPLVAKFYKPHYHSEWSDWLQVAMSGLNHKRKGLKIVALLICPSDMVFSE
jgi:hypothetical protein